MLRYVLFRFVPLPSLPLRYVHHITLGLDQTTNFSWDEQNFNLGRPKLS